MIETVKRLRRKKIRGIYRTPPIEETIFPVEISAICSIPYKVREQTSPIEIQQLVRKELAFELGIKIVDSGLLDIIRSFDEISDTLKYKTSILVIPQKERDKK